MIVPVLFVTGYAVAVNLFAFLLFGVDKKRARRGEYRISEGALLSVAMAGDSVGAKAGQKWYRHKTRKQPFAAWLNLIILSQITIIALGLWALMAGPKQIPIEAMSQ